jgi:UDP-N-acetyl-D-glucosamine dehydrogenase
MPKFIANRALSLIANKSHSPRVLILGVAYKPGVSDVRETPVAELRDQLLAKGAEVAWYDPLVSKWEDSTPVNLEWDCDVAILATMQPGMNLKPLINRGTKILDCTNTLDKSQNIIGI